MHAANDTTSFKSDPVAEYGTRARPALPISNGTLDHVLVISLDAILCTRAAHVFPVLEAEKLSCRFMGRTDARTR